MNVIIKKRQIIMSALVLALGSAVFVNWYFNKPNAEQTAKEESASYSIIGDAQYVSANSEKHSVEETVKNDFSQTQLKRSKAHDEAFDKLKSVINDSSASKAAVDKAAEDLAKLSNSIKLEADIEALVKSKCGFNCVVMINGSSAQVVCEKSTLDSTVILQIKEIFLKHTDINSENITIFELK